MVDDRRVFRPFEPTHHDYVMLAFDQIRACARTQVTVLASMLVSLQTVRTELVRRDRVTVEAMAALQHQVGAVIAEIRLSGASEESKASALALLDRTVWHMDG